MGTLASKISAAKVDVSLIRFKEANVAKTVKPFINPP
jgi:hypothetical protein